MEIRRISIIARESYPELKRIGDHFEVCDKGDVCLAIGGDGTFLRATQKCECPILHIRDEKRDSLGFHADVSLRDIDEVIRDLKRSEYSIEEYDKLRITCKDQVYEAVNDVVLFRANPKSVHWKVYRFDNTGQKTALYPDVLRGDGILFCRQIGSTAYNFFSHGPIIFGVNVVAITPISANFSFSIVSEGDFLVEITKNIGSLQYDGLEIAQLCKGDTFTVSRSSEVVKVLKLQMREHFSEKMARLCTF